MIQVIFLILVLMSSVAFAQTDEIPKATKSAEFGKVTNGYIKMMLDSFYTELSNNPAAQGYIINYGAGREVARVENVIRNQIKVRRFDSSRVTFVAGGGDEELITQFWVVPAGADTPKLTPMAYKIDEFGTLSQRNWIKRVKSVRAKLEKLKSSPIQVQIINYGTDKEITVAESLIKNYLYENCYDCFGFGGMRIILIRGGFLAKPKRQFWIIPEGAKAPKP